MKWIRKAVEKGDARAEQTLGHRYFFGNLGVQKDDAEAIKWLRNAAEHGDAETQCHIGFEFFSGGVRSTRYS